jgi:UDP-N-acetylglucosamine acyltransferase
MPQVHRTAIVEDGARLADDAVVGPYCCVGAEVELGPGVRLEAHVVVAGRTRVGEGTRVFPFASIGHQPQDMKFKGEKSELVIGRHNVIRENVTMNPGTEGGGLITSVGDHCLFMAGAHVAHDCRLGDHVIMVNNTLLGGHVEVGDHAIVGGLSAVHQFVRIGKHAMIGGMTGVEQDVIPFGLVTGNRASLVGLNLVGLKRRGFEREEIARLRSAYAELFGATAGTFQERLEATAPRYADSRLVQEVVAFIRSASSRGVCQPPANAGAA